MFDSAKSNTQALSRPAKPLIVAPQSAIGLQDTGSQQVVVNIAHSTAKELMPVDEPQNFQMPGHGDFWQVVHGFKTLLAPWRTAAGYFANDHVVHKHLIFL